MNVLLIQENGRHEENRGFRECFCLQRAFKFNRNSCDVWGLGHTNYEQEPDYESYDLIINLENYDESGWFPNLSKVQTKKWLWSIDAHCKGILPYLRVAQEGNYDLILQATPEFVNKDSLWFPSGFDDNLLYPLGIEKTYDWGFCGSAGNTNRNTLIAMLQKFTTNYKHKLDIFAIGPSMVKAINSYKVHFNANIGIDINYRNFETIGCGTCLLTTYNKHLYKLGFTDGENCLIYSTFEELIEKLKMILENYSLRTTIESNGLELSQRHNYNARVKFLLDYIKGDSRTIEDTFYRYRSTQSPFYS